jgi:hypothetical protein
MESMLMDAGVYLFKVVSTTFSQLFILLGPGLILALIMYFVSDFTRSRASVVLGYKFFIYFTAIGTVIHELGHAIFAVLFGHRIVEINLFDPDQSTGLLGYVKHSYNPKSIFQTIGNFFIGIGPIILGSLVIFLAAKFTVGNTLFQPLVDIPITAQSFSSFQNAGGLIQDIFSHTLQVLRALFRVENLGNGWFYLFIYLVFAIGSHVKLSMLDLKNAWTGFAVLIAAFLLFNLVTVWTGDFSMKYITLVSQSYSFFYAYMLFAIVLTSAFLVLMLALYGLKRVVRR